MHAREAALSVIFCGQIMSQSLDKPQDGILRDCTAFAQPLLSAGNFL
jgi:hypothetical protein